MSILERVKHLPLLPSDMLTAIQVRYFLFYAGQFICCFKHAHPVAWAVERMLQIRNSCSTGEEKGDKWCTEDPNRRLRAAVAMQEAKGGLCRMKRRPLAHQTHSYAHTLLSSSMQLTLLPDTMSGMPKLTGLLVRNNLLKKLPDALGFSPSLCILDLANNELTVSAALVCVCYVDSM